MTLFSLFPADLLPSATLLLLVMDPLGNVPIFLSVLKDIELERRRHIILRELLFALALMLTFLFFGQEFLDLLGLDPESVRISGGVILFVIALRMIFPRERKEGGDEPRAEEPFIVPLAIPLVAGPSTIATLILMARQDPDRMGTWAMATGLAWIINACVLLSAPWLYRVLRKRGLAAMERLMGMILIMLSIQMLVDAMRGLYVSITCP